MDISQRHFFYRICIICVLLLGGFFVEAQQSVKLNAILQQGHSNTVTKIAIDNKSRFVVTADIIGNVKFWDFKTGLLIKTVRAGGCVSDIKLSADGESMITCDYDLHTVLIWNLNDFTWKVIKGISFINNVEFRPSSHLFACITHDKIEFIDLTTLSVVRTINSTDPKVTIDDGLLAFTKDGKRMAVRASRMNTPGSSPTLSAVILIIDCETNQIVQTLSGASFYSHSLSFSTSGEYLISTGDEYELSIWNVNTGKLQYSKGVKNIRYHFTQFIKGDKIMALGEDRREKAGDNSSFIESRSFDLGSQLSSLHNLYFNGGDVYGPAIYSNGDSLVAFKTPENAVKIANIFNFDNNLEISKPFKALHDVRVQSQTGRFFITKENEIKVWDIASQTFVGGTIFPQPVKYVSFNEACTDALTLKVTGSLGGLWDIEKNTYNKVFDAPSKAGFLGSSSEEAFHCILSPDGKMAALGNMQGQIMLCRYPFTKIDTIIGEFDVGKEGNLVSAADAISFSVNNRWVAFSGIFANKVKVYDQQSKELHIIQPTVGVNCIVISNDNTLSFLDEFGAIYFYDLKNKVKLIDSLARDGGSLSGGIIRFSKDSKKLVHGNVAGTVTVWDWQHKKMINQWQLNNEIHSIEFLNNDSLLVVNSGNANFKIFDVNSKDELLTVSFFNERDWVAYTPEGFFDGTKEAWDLLPMSFSATPWTLYNPEQFFNVFYEPGLIYDILKERKDIVSILKEKNDERAKIDISKYVNSKIPMLEMQHLSRNGSRKQDDVFRFNVKNKGSGVRNLKIFLDNMLVFEVEKELKANTPDGGYTVDVPVELRSGKNYISAYVFNDDNIRSKEVSLEITRNDIPKSKGDVHLLNIGINDYKQKTLKLNYAIADAKLFSETICQSFRGLRDYKNCFTYDLYDANATRDKIINSFYGLNGNGNVTSRQFNIQKVQPDDVLVIFYSGHGYASGNNFYLIPQDVEVTGKENDVKNGISDIEISALLKSINCKGIILIIDACQSGQAIGSSIDKLGPFNSRGLAQLAYEKGMYVMAASQSQESALEIDALGHGLLTYTMIIKGLQESKADYDPKDKKINVIEWLNFSAINVPQEYKNVVEDKIKTKKITPTSSVKSQTPKVYFRRENYYNTLLIKKV